MPSTDISTIAPRRILICQLKQIGDVLLTTPCAELLARRYPGAEIHFLTFDYCAPVLENNPYITRIWALPSGGSFFKTFRFLFRAARQGYDLAVDFQQLPRCVLAMLLTDAPTRLTFTPKRHKRLFYTSWTENKGTYATAMKSSILAPLGISWNKEPPRIHLTEQERTEADGWLKRRGFMTGERLITIDASHRHETHRWAADRFGATLGRIHEAYPDTRFLLLFGPGEKSMAQAVLDTCPVPERCILPDHQTSLRELAALMSHASLHLGNCSAPRHFAVALGVPSMTIIGGNGTTAWTFPSDEHRIAHNYIPCHKCNKPVCPKGTLECLEDLTVDMVFEPLCALLEGRPGRRKNTPAMKYID